MNQKKDLEELRFRNKIENNSLEKAHFVKMNELKLTQVELF